MDSGALIIETLARGGAVGAFAGLALVIARGSASPARLTGVLFCLAAAAHTLTQQSAIASALGVAGPPVWAFSVMGAGLFWAFATALFEDRPRLEAVRFAPAALLLAIAAGAALADGAAANALLLVHNVLAVALLAHVLLIVWRGWRNDLVESRRRLRGPLLAAAALYAAAVTAVQISEILWRPAGALSPLAAILLFALGLASIATLLKADADLFGAGRKPARPDREAAEAPDVASPLTVEDARLGQRLNHVMREDRLYRQEGLSIAALALRLGTPEYRLRRLINQRLGYRNFSAFLNAWRLSDAKLALGDPGQRDVPISTIALDAGFQSLGPFNRAFRAETGQTPTDYRARALSGAEGEPSAALQTSD